MVAPTSPQRHTNSQNGICHDRIKNLQRASPLVQLLQDDDDEEQENGSGSANKEEEAAAAADSSLIMKTMTMTMTDVLKSIFSPRGPHAGSDVLRPPISTLFRTRIYSARVSPTADHTFTVTLLGANQSLFCVGAADQSADPDDMNSIPRPWSFSSISGTRVL
jgi:hypothetical protein